MSDAPFIPPKTRDKLAAFHPEGTRHIAKIELALSLIGNGIPPEAVAETLRQKFPNATEQEIRSVVDWCVARNPTPSGHGKPINGNRHASPQNGKRLIIHRPDKPVKPAPTPEKIIAATNGDNMDESDWRDASKVPLPDDFMQDAETLLLALYAAEDRINIVCSFTVNNHGKANPDGAGKTLLRDEWVTWFREKGVPCSKAGAWVRPNPCKQNGSGAKGAQTDADVSAFRFILIESDNLPIAKQLGLYSTLELPIAAIILSGGDSAHAWLRVDAKNEADYKAIVDELYEILVPIGFCKSNKNPSRLSRLPGCPRVIGASGDKQQRLIYINPNPSPLVFAEFREHLSCLGSLVRADALEARMLAHLKPRAKAMTLEMFEGDTPDEGFYFRDSEVTVWSGAAGQGKSTILLQVMFKLLTSNIPFFVCSLEYKPEQLCLMLARSMHRRSAISEADAKEFLFAFGKCFHFSDTVGEIAADQLLSMMRVAHRKNGARHFFIDSLMRVAGLEEDYPAQGQFLNDLQAVAKQTSGHIHLVAHPRKFDEDTRARKTDVKGSSLIINNADNIVMIRRNFKKLRMQEEGELTPEQDKEMHDSEFYVEKQRETGWLGIFRLRFDKATKTFDLFTPPLREPPKTQDRYKTE